jgi:hypothetical protein
MPDPLKDLLRLGGLILTCLSIVLVLIATAGLIGIRLGFEPLMGLPARTLGWSDFLVFGFEIARSLPSIIMLVGDQQILLPVLGFMLIGMPAALLVIARPRVPGGPPLRPQIQGLAVAGSIFSSLFYVGAFVWLVGPWRSGVLGGVVSDSEEYAQWFESFIIIFGVDAFLVCAMVPWLIFAYRLPLLRELQFTTRGIAVIGSIFILFGAAISLGLHNGLMKSRLSEGSNMVLVGTVGDDLLIIEFDPNSSDSSCVIIDAETVRFDSTGSIDELMREPSA